MRNVTWEGEVIVINLTSFPSCNLENTNCQQSVMPRMETRIIPIKSSTVCFYMGPIMKFIVELLGLHPSLWAQALHSFQSPKFMPVYCRTPSKISQYLRVLQNLGEKPAIGNLSSAKIYTFPVIYCYVIDHSKIKWLKTICYYFSYLEWLSAGQFFLGISNAIAVIL